MNAQRIAEVLRQVRVSHQRRLDESREMAPTWRETAKVVLMTLVLLVAFALLIVVGSD